MPPSPVSLDVADQRTHRTYWQDVWLRLRRHRIALVALAVFGLIILFSLVGPLTSSESFSKTNLRDRLLAPSAEHIFGTDELGRDIALRVMIGGQVSLLVGFAVALISVLIGVTAGAISGYSGGFIDSLLMRFADIMLSIPSLPLLLILSRYGGGSVLSIVLILSAFNWMGLARLVRGTILSIKQREYVEAARMTGARTGRIVLRHVLPGTLAPVIVNATLTLGFAIIAESSLSYLGLGVQPPTPTWGQMLIGAQQYMESAPWLALIPGLFLFVTLLCINFLGDGLRDALDPRMTIQQ
ncbi:ABC transporter permease [Chloroflexi bacterium TSY]|nr:ABC transporter permease [Chloroflexi bacterium TSY]